MIALQKPRRLILRCCYCWVIWKRNVKISVRMSQLTQIFYTLNISLQTLQAIYLKGIFWALDQSHLYGSFKSILLINNYNCFWQAKMWTRIWFLYNIINYEITLVTNRMMFMYKDSPLLCFVNICHIRHALFNMKCIFHEHNLWRGVWDQWIVHELVWHLCKHISIIDWLFCCTSHWGCIIAKTNWSY